MPTLCAGEVDENSRECLRRPKKVGTESYLYGWGPNEFSPMGTLKDFDYTDRLHEIDAPCLIISGTNDLCTPLVAKTMYAKGMDIETIASMTDMDKNELEKLLG